MSVDLNAVASEAGILDEIERLGIQDPESRARVRQYMVDALAASDPSHRRLSPLGEGNILMFFAQLLRALFTQGNLDNLQDSFGSYTDSASHQADRAMIDDALSNVYIRLMQDPDPEVSILATRISGHRLRGSHQAQIDAAGLGDQNDAIGTHLLLAFDHARASDITGGEDTPGPDNGGSNAPLIAQTPEPDAQVRPA